MTRRDEEASAWFARMRGPDAERHRPAFEAWRADPANAAAYADAEEDWVAVGGLPPKDRIAGGPAATDTRRAPARWAAAAALFLTLACGAAWDLRPAPAAGETAAGSDPAASAAAGPAAPNRELRLADGSLVVLTGGARIEPHIDGQRREILLLGGRARFIVAHDADRPFVVKAGASETIALGTVFEVDFRQRHPLVHLVSGSVEVRAGHGKRGVRLTPGESAEVGDAEAWRVAAEVSVSGTTILQAERLALGGVIERANRLGGPPIRLAEPALAARRVSGRFDITDRASLARKLAAALDLDIAFGAGGPVLSAKEKKAGE